MEKKYYLDKEDTIEFEGRTLYRIVALRDLLMVRKGAKGGYIEREYNLSHEGNCWVFNNAKVCGYAQVLDNTRLHGNAVATDFVELRNGSEMHDSSRASGNAKMFNNASLYDNASIRDKAQMFNDSTMSGNAELFGSGILQDRASIEDNVRVKDVTLGNIICIGEDAVIESVNDFVVFVDYWNKHNAYTWTRSNNKWSSLMFSGTREEVLNNIELYYGDSAWYTRYFNFVENNECINSSLED